jgi:hypothetical protein
METNIKTIALGILVASTTLFSCQKEQLIPLKPGISEQSTVLKPKPVTENYSLVNTKWKITHFDNLGTDYTDYYLKNTFGFYSNHLLLAMEGNIALEKGKWSSESEAKRNLTLSFPAESRFYNLSGLWRISNQSNTMLFLETDRKDGVVYITMERVIPSDEKEK